jgi:hypothetical protein
MGRLVTEVELTGYGEADAVAVLDQLRGVGAVQVLLVVDTDSFTELPGGAAAAVDDLRRELDRVGHARIGQLRRCRREYAARWWPE